MRRRSRGVEPGMAFSISRASRCARVKAGTVWT
jgi:hypothetical protein